MAFRVKDLMINVLPSEGEPGGILSRFPCHCGCTYGFTRCTTLTEGGGQPEAFGMMCAWNSAACPLNSDACLWTFFCPTWFSGTGTVTRIIAMCPGFDSFTTSPFVVFGGDPATAAEQLAALKAQLREAIAQIENQEKVVSELAKPQSVAEIEELQGKLKDALNELERRKSELKKQ